MRRVLSYLLLASAAISCTEQPSNVVLPEAIAPSFVAHDDDERVPGEYTVLLKPEVDDPSSVAAETIRRFGGEIYSVWHGMKGFWGKLPPEAVEALRGSPFVRYVEEVVYYSAVGTRDTQDVSSGNWGLDRIDQRQLPLDDLYGYNNDGTGVRVWIVDSGVDDDELELAGRIDHGLYIYHKGTDPFSPCHPHGTQMAIAAAGFTYGAAKNSVVNVARVTDGTSTDCDEGKAKSGAIAEALQKIVDHSPRPAVVNLSLSRECGFCGSTVDDAVRYAISNGIPVVVAAGNDGNDACDYSPARVAEAITVGATDAGDRRASDLFGDWSSNYGTCLDLFAPGKSLYIGPVYLGDTYYGSYTGGTSAATAMVSGTLALYTESGGTAATSHLLQNTTTSALSDIGSGSPNELLYSISFDVDVFGP